MLPTIVAFYVQSFVCVPSLSSPLLLRNYPNTFAFIPIPPMSLSSLNRSNSKAFCHILPCVAPVCEGMHYHKTGVPWQMKSTFIIVIYPHLILLYFQHLQQFRNISMIVFLFTFLAYFGITLHNFSFVWAKYWAIFKPFSPQPFSSLLRHPQTANEYMY